MYEGGATGWPLSLREPAVPSFGIGMLCGILENRDGVTVAQVMAFVDQGVQDCSKLKGYWKFEIMMPSAAEWDWPKGDN